MTLYLDTSAVVPLFTTDPLSHRADDVMVGRQSVLIVSNFTAAEFTSVVARRYRTRELTAEEAEEALSNFEDWTFRETARVEISPADLVFATAAMRRLDLPLRTADGIHLAIARRYAAEVATFDRQMARCAAALGLTAIGGDQR